MTCSCVFAPVDRLNGSSNLEAADSEETGDSVSTVTRVMVSQNRLYSDSVEVVALQVFSEVIEVEGKEVRLMLLLHPSAVLFCMYVSVCVSGSLAASSRCSSLTCVRSRS